MPAILRCTSLLFTLVTLSPAVLVNRTIDDQYGDPITRRYPVYSPVGDWQQGATCSDCAIKPNVSKAFHGTWHDSTFYPGSTPKSVSVTFNGSAVYAFFITSPVLTTTTTTQTEAAPGEVENATAPGNVEVEDLPEDGEDECPGDVEVEHPPEDAEDECPPDEVTPAASSVL